MRQFFIAAGLLLASTLAATAQTSAPGCGDIGTDPAQLDGACPPGRNSGGSIGSGTTSSGSGTSEIPPLVVPNDPLGQSTDSGTTSSVPGAPQGMPPLIVPNDPLGTGNRDTLSSGGTSSSPGNLSPGRRSGAIQSPSVD
jgi:hypothetical protein